MQCGGVFLSLKQLRLLSSWIALRVKDSGQANSHSVVVENTECELRRDFAATRDSLRDHHNGLPRAIQSRLMTAYTCFVEIANMFIDNVNVST